VRVSDCGHATKCRVVVRAPAVSHGVIPATPTLAGPFSASIGYPGTSLGIRLDD